ncbi:MAG: permease [Spirochaetaceae bacterium]|jgi:uncharacterized membrane protein YraQ (UPF0718 family)|nr:permease [Spirochaetaceae bacterium]
MDEVRRYAIYLWYYFEVQFEQIAGYYLLGVLIGSLISVFGKNRIHALLTLIQKKPMGVLGIIPASLIGVASPLCMYGTIPIAASFSEKGVQDDWLAAFMMSSILLNPQLIIYSAALGPTALMVRIVSCFLCGIFAGLLVRMYTRRWFRQAQPPGRHTVVEPVETTFFNFSGFAAPSNHDTHPNPLLRLIFNIGRNLKATGLYFLIGIALAAIFQTFIPQDAFARLFGSGASSRGFGILMAATVGVPLYVCGGGTIPLLQAWLDMGMSMGAASAFMITGQSMKITNMGAVKIIMGVRHFVFYIVFVIVSALVSGFITDILTTADYSAIPSRN